MQDVTAITDAICTAALKLGFCRVGISPVEASPASHQALQSWLAHGYHGHMHYMQTPRSNAALLLPAAQSLIVVAMAYPKSKRADNNHIAAYAQGLDYHHVLHGKLQTLAEQCRVISKQEVITRPCVDSAPLLERHYAVQAGIGFAAKSTMTIVPGIGSYVLLGELLINMPLRPSTPSKPRCGTCSMCIAACPTQAFVGPYLLDARRCIAYLTIELRGSIPRELRSSIGQMIFGCDICQQVCPFNASEKPIHIPQEMQAYPHLQQPNLEHLLHIGAAAYRKFVKGTALQRISRAQLSRNAAVALGNSGNKHALPALIKALQHHLYPLVRAHAAWAIGALQPCINQDDITSAMQSLSNASQYDTDSNVQQEANLALQFYH